MGQPVDTWRLIFYLQKCKSPLEIFYIVRTLVSMYVLTFGMLRLYLCGNYLTFVFTTLNIFKDFVK